MGEWSNVLAYVTSAGGNDGLTFGTETAVGTSSCVAFEANIKFTGPASGDIYQIMFCGESNGSKIAYMINLKFTGGTFWMVDCSSTGDAGNRVENEIRFPANVVKDEWFKIRVEYYTGSKSTVRTKVFLNDVHVYTSNNYYGQLLDGNDKPFYNQVNYVKFYSLGATAGTMYLDNVKLYGTNDTCNEAVGKK
jgi:hypothetical protein